MSLASIILFVLAAVLILVGVLLSFTALPGIWLVFAGYAVSCVADGDDRFSIVLLGVVFCVVLFASIIDNVMSLSIARKTGATGWGLVGAFAGSVVGLFAGGIVGVLVGSFAGAFVAEFIIMKREWKPSAKSGVGAVLGWLIGTVLKFAFSVGLAVMWVVILI